MSATNNGAYWAILPDTLEACHALIRRMRAEKDTLEKMLGEEEQVDRLPANNLEKATKNREENV